MGNSVCKRKSSRYIKEIIIDHTHNNTYVYYISMPINTDCTWKLNIPYVEVTTLESLYSNLHSEQYNILQSKISSIISSKRPDKIHIGVYQDDTLINIKQHYVENYFETMCRDYSQISCKLFNQTDMVLYRALSCELAAKYHNMVSTPTNPIMYISVDDMNINIMVPYINFQMSIPLGIYSIKNEGELNIINEYFTNFINDKSRQLNTGIEVAKRCLKIHTDFTIIALHECYHIADASKIESINETLLLDNVTSHLKNTKTSSSYSIYTLLENIKENFVGNHENNIYIKFIENFIIDDIDYWNTWTLGLFNMNNPSYSYNCTPSNILKRRGVPSLYINTRIV